MTSRPHRRDIDGLRSIAILPVVLFHAAPGLLPGGYLGVDIFFVISGYLIASLIFSALDENRFSFGQFYLRRIKRLMPAYIVMIGLVLLIGLALLTPREILPLAKTALFSTVSASNFQLAMGGDYFAPDTASNPLMHTWSLAIEEQFYLVFPLLAFLVYRGARRRLGFVLGLVFLASLAVGVHLEANNSTWAHYSPLARAWQLCAGCGLALLHMSRPGRELSSFVAEASSLLALAIFGALFMLSPGSLSATAAGLVASIATLILIHHGRRDGGTLVARLLSFRAPVMIGLISYSTYLWHQPIIATLKLFPMMEGAFFVPLGILLSLAAGWISWRYVETPVRYSRVSAARLLPRIFTGLATAGLVSAAIILGSGLSSRFPGGTLLTPLSFEGAEIARVCGLWGVQSISTEDICALEPSRPANDALGTVAIWGDSHAASLFAGFTQADRDFPIVSMAFHGCYVGSAENRPASETRHCAQKRAVALAYLASHPEVKTVIVDARWEYTLHPNSNGVDLRSSSMKMIEDIANLGRQVIVVDSVPIQKREVLPLHNRMTRLGLKPVQSLPLPDYLDELRRRPPEFLQLLDRLGAPFVSLVDVFCDREAGVCPSHDAEGVPLYEDEGHLTPVGGKRIADLIIERYLSTKQ